MHLGDFWTFGRAEEFPKVQKSLPIPDLLVVKTLEKRRVKHARPSLLAADFWTVLTGAPLREQKSKTPSPEGMAKNRVLTRRGLSSEGCAVHVREHGPPGRLTF
jgi:hypothetical protein